MINSMATRSASGPFQLLVVAFRGAGCLHSGTLGDHFDIGGDPGRPWEQEGHTGVQSLIFNDVGIGSLLRTEVKMPLRFRIRFQLIVCTEFRIKMRPPGALKNKFSHRRYYPTHFFTEIIFS